jgi:hypothetical protein
MIAMLMLAGMVIVVPSLSGMIDGRPDSRALELVALVAVSLLSGSIILALPALVLGVMLAAFERTRKSGIVALVYSAAYLCGGAIGGGVYFLLRAFR